MTISELKLLAGLSKPALHTMLKGQSLSQAMGFRREIQVALTSYSVFVRGDDPVKAGAVVACQQIESWCRDAYMRRRKYEILGDPSHRRLGKPWKWVAKKEWEDLCRRKSY